MAPFSRYVLGCCFFVESALIPGRGLCFFRFDFSSGQRVYRRLVTEATEYLSVDFSVPVPNRKDLGRLAGVTSTTPNLNRTDQDVGVYNTSCVVPGPSLVWACDNPPAVVVDAGS